MRFLRNGLIGLFLMALSLGLLAYAGQMVKTAINDRMSKETRAPQARERVFTVNVVPAAPETISPVLEVFGEIQSRRTLDLRLPSSGQVIELSPNFIEGGQVQAGEVLVRVNDADAQSVLARAKADVTDALGEVTEAERAIALAQDELAAAQQQADLRQRAYERQQDLQTRGVGTAASVEAAELAASSAAQSVLSRRSALDQAKSRQSQAQTRLTRAELAAADAQRRLDDTVLRAEFAGVLSGITLVQGGLVGANERIGQLIDPSALEAAFRVSTEQYSRLLDDAGQLIPAKAGVSLSVMGTELTSDAVISRDAGAVGDGQTGRLVFAQLDKPIGLKPGDFVSVKVQEPELRFAIRLPGTALDAANSVLVVDQEDRLEKIDVTLLRRQGNDVIVRSRDLVGREVVAQQTPLLGAGIKVKPLRAADRDGAPAEPETVELTEERRAKLIAYVEGNGFIPDAAKTRILGQLKQEKVPAQVVERLESRM
ncbi:efflux transporter periplasmic adaptor subunit [Rhodobacteraceae bacterium]|nr:efflux transporter periplasmic adaptor subunit [Paracoccaceae bacterium]